MPSEAGSFWPPRRASPIEAESPTISPTSRITPGSSSWSRSFMVRSPGWGSGGRSGSRPDNPDFWVAFFNPQFLPQVLTRTGGAFLLASLYIYLHAAFRAKDPEVRSLIASRSTKRGRVGAALVAAGAAWWYLALPESSAAALARASALNILLALVVGATVVVYLMLYLGPYPNPGWITPGFAILLFLFGLSATGAGVVIPGGGRQPPT